MSIATECGGTMGQHAWVISAMVDLAAYAERNGMKRLNEQLCHALATAMTGELYDLPVAAAAAPSDTRAESVVYFDMFERKTPDRG